MVSYGIDFGTTNTAVIECLFTEEGMTTTMYGENNQPFPSLVALHPEKPPLFGMEVKRRRSQLKAEGYEVISSFKSILGGNQTMVVGGRWFSPVGVTALFLEFVKTSVEQQSGSTMGDAVIAIPVDFSPEQRYALREAASRAGITVRSLVSEPTAAYIYNRYSKSQITGASNIAVFDWGGGTLDVSILSAANGAISELAVAAGHKSLAPWIGMILGGCTDLFVSKEEFADRAMEHGIEDIGAKWDALMSLDPHTRSAVLHRREVLARLVSMDALPAECLNRPGDGVVVSTVHRAKGSEADHVYWLDSPLVFDNQADTTAAKSDALKASYVAVTRAKRDIRLVKPEKAAMRSLSNDHWIKLGWSGHDRPPFCSGIALRPDDVDLLSCASGANVQQMQEVIGSLEPGLDAVLHLSSDGTYFDIFFDGCQIGRTSAALTNALWEGFRVTNKNKKMPAYITYAYISALVTVIDPSGAKGENEYQSSGCWLGYELGGIAHINYS